MKLRGKTVLEYYVGQPTTVHLMLRPRHHAQQAIVEETFHIDPPVAFSEYTDHHGNHCQRLILPTGYITVTSQVEAIVTSHHTPDVPFPQFVLIENLPNEVLHYLLPSRYCQSDLGEIYQLAIDIVEPLINGYEQVEAIRSWINTHISYEYNTTNSSTTALDTVHQRMGVCRDFTHLAIALCRALCMPARMTVGYSDKLKYVDLHAWFEVYLTDGWHTFDAVQAQTEGCRVVLGHGRDAADVAMANQFGNAELRYMQVKTELIDEDP